jgi:predicted nucleic acid-binding protein
LRLPAAVVADANVLLAALIGGRAAQVLRHPRAPACFASQDVYDEIAEHLPHLAARRGLDLPLLKSALVLLPVAWLQSDQYAAYETEARRRVADRDPDDWPTVALAIALKLPVWSQDKDFVSFGLPVYTTGQILDLLRDKPLAP